MDWDGQEVIFEVELPNPIALLDQAPYYSDPFHLEMVRNKVGIHGPRLITGHNQPFPLGITNMGLKNPPLWFQTG